MTSAMATIANGGKLVTPRIVKSVTASDGKIISSVSPVVLRQVISPETAKQIGDALRGVVSDQGTAAAAAVPGFTIAGKTGTAQKVNPNGGYDHGKSVVSFLGYLPADHPAFVGLVVLDDAHTSKPELNYGGKVAGPIFSHVAEKAARYLNLEPHEEIRKADSHSASRKTKAGRATPQGAGGTNRLNRWFATLSAPSRFAVANPSPVGDVKASCSSRYFSLRLQFAKSSGQLIVRWKTSRMTRGECKGTPCSWRCAARKMTGTNSSVTPSIKGRR
jgi:membrane peptidoglycan carboxypeptidase